METALLAVGDIVVAKLDPPGPGTEDYWRQYGVEFEVEIKKINVACECVDIEIFLEDEEVLDDWMNVCGFSETEIEELGQKVGDKLYLPDVPSRSILEIKERLGVTVATGDHYLIKKNVQRHKYGGRTAFAIYEFDPQNGEPLYTWKENGQHRSSLEVEVSHPRHRYGGTGHAEVSWPSTSDKRPALARALSEALRLAADEALAEDRRWAEARADTFFENREPGDVMESEWEMAVADFLKEMV